MRALWRLFFEVVVRGGYIFRIYVVLSFLVVDGLGDIILFCILSYSRWRHGCINLSCSSRVVTLTAMGSQTNSAHTRKNHGMTGE